ncbi:MAG: CerR family C-terminal domain-containing protein [Proteobacteria bacterium]|jgi:TetR/AcrR family transcriptional regulator|nr:CerR family C-terminal domain-containing protein [Pseudomonadota bacterium]MDA1291530.1 CerR family C-terminal domain-containing protein [Pseudomonadota bacterium]
MKRSTTKSAALGRPSGRDSDKVRRDLLQAARDHFLKRDFKAVSLRQIASSAGVNGAMVNYYFGGKQGLYLAMVDELFESLESKMAGLSNNAEFSIADFSHSYCLLLAENPWWPNFVAREILFGEGETKEEVLQRFSKMIAPKLRQAINQEVESGNYRKDLSPELTIMSLLGMAIFPFLAAPVIERVFGTTIDESMANKLAAHNVELFMNGVVNHQQRNTGETAS